MMKSIFITGTDTDIGKTHISVLLLKKFNALGFKTFAMKPLASGCEEDIHGHLKSKDALCLQAAASIRKPYHIVNPISLKEPIAPHLAARKMNISLSTSLIKNTILFSLQSEADINLIEGIGGWLVPLNYTEFFSDIIDELKMPVILVVGMKLGCLNHALLTFRNIIDKEIPFIGWIANCLVPDMLAIKENIMTLEKCIQQPCLGIVPCDGQSLDCIDTQPILKFLSNQ